MELLNAHETDLRPVINDRVVDQALSRPIGIFRKQWIPHLKEVFYDWNAAGAEIAAANLERAVSDEKGTGGATTKSAKAPVSTESLMGNWSASVIGQAAGFSVISRYSLNADGTFSRGSESGISFGAMGSAIGKRGLTGGSWSVEQRTLRLTPPNGAALVLEITDFNGNGMITRRSNGDRWLWNRTK